jgi:hypothetical protein
MRDEPKINYIRLDFEPGKIDKMFKNGFQVCCEGDKLLFIKHYRSKIVFPKDYQQKE